MKEMFNSPFADDKNAQIGNSTQQFNTQNGGQYFSFEQTTMPPTQPQVNVPPNVNPVQSKSVVTGSDMDKIIQSLRPQAMSNPVKIVEPSYVVTERQLQQMMALAQGNPNVSFVASQPQQGFAQQLPQGQQVLAPGQYQPQQVIQQSESKSWFDELGNITFGTVGRIGHTLTTVADGVIDILTLGYATRK